MANIYIAYNSNDVKIADAISKGLIELGHNVSMGSDSPSAFNSSSNLLSTFNDSDCFIALLTSKSFPSQYILREIRTARAFIQSSGKILLIPVLFEEIEMPSVIDDIYSIRGSVDNIDDIIANLNQSIINYIGRRAAEEEKEKEDRERIEINAAEYIEDAISSLTKRESINKVIANIWHSLGYIALLMGVAFAVFGLKNLSPEESLKWYNYLPISLQSIIAVGLLIASSKYAFTLGKSHMNESLKSADRIHAISFGKFYLRVFSNRANWQELKEVFQHWNIDKNSSFSTLDADKFDPKFLEVLAKALPSTKTNQK